MLKKAQKLLIEIIVTPTNGTGQVELLNHEMAGLYSRRITKKHGLIYKINDEKNFVSIIAATSHYGNK